MLIGLEFIGRADFISLYFNSLNILGLDGTIQ